MENTKKKNIFATAKNMEVSHWFLTPKSSEEVLPAPKKSHRINDIDSNILQEKSFADYQKDPLKIEYKIDGKHKILQSIKEKIKAADAVGNQQELFNLRVRKQRYEQELRSLYKEYNDASNMPNRTYDDIKNEYAKHRTKRLPVINAIKRFIKRNILAKISPKFKALVAISDSLETLDSINKNVDELLKIKSPYGETKENYEKLTEYLYNAQKIRSQIGKSMRVKK